METLNCCYWCLAAGEDSGEKECHVDYGGHDREHSADDNDHAGP